MRLSASHRLPVVAIAVQRRDLAAVSICAALCRRRINGDLLALRAGIFHHAQPGGTGGDDAVRRAVAPPPRQSRTRGFDRVLAACFAAQMRWCWRRWCCSVAGFAHVRTLASTLHPEVAADGSTSDAFAVLPDGEATGFSLAFNAPSDEMLRHRPLSCARAARGRSISTRATGARCRAAASQATATASPATAAGGGLVVLLRRRTLVPAPRSPRWTPTWKLTRSIPIANSRAGWRRSLKRRPRLVSSFYMVAIGRRRNSRWRRWRRSRSARFSRARPRGCCGRSWSRSVTACRTAGPFECGLAALALWLAAARTWGLWPLRARALWIVADACRAARLQRLVACSARLPAAVPYRAPRTAMVAAAAAGASGATGCAPGAGADALLVAGRARAPHRARQNAALARVRRSARLLCPTNSAAPISSTRALAQPGLALTRAEPLRLGLADYLLAARTIPAPTLELDSGVERFGPYRCLGSDSRSMRRKMPMAPKNSAADSQRDPHGISPE